MIRNYIYIHKATRREIRQGRASAKGSHDRGIHQQSAGNGEQNSTSIKALDLETKKIEKAGQAGEKRENPKKTEQPSYFGWNPGKPIPPDWRSMLGDLAGVVDAAQEARDLAEDGKAEQGLKRFEKAILEHPEARKLAGARGLRAWLYEQAGKQELEAGRPNSAAQDFLAGLDLAPDSPGLRAGIARAHMANHEFESALVQVERGLLASPSDPVLLELKSFLAWKLDDVQAAKKAAAKLTHTSPGSLRAAAMEMRINKEAAVEGKLRKLGRHFIIRYQGPRDRQTADLVMSALERTRQRLRRELGAEPQGLVVALLYTRQQFRGLTGSPAWAGGGFDGKIRLFTARADVHQLEVTASHEYVHALVFDLAGSNCPRWLQEGLAQYFQEDSRKDSLLSRLQGFKRFLPLSSLDKALINPDQSISALAYLESLTLVAYIIQKRGARDMVRALRRISQGQTTDAAIKTTCGDAPAKLLEKALADFK
ncbi:MAG: tetratricopeptide repeat protein [Deltaproteobacteria bacterium]|nr:tetratricopeptide repeat protein [Deltaproteobacteria bacterium]